MLCANTEKIMQPHNFIYDLHLRGRTIIKREKTPVVIIIAWFTTRNNIQVLVLGISAISAIRNSNFRITSSNDNEDGYNEYSRASTRAANRANNFTLDFIFQTVSSYTYDEKLLK